MVMPPADKRIAIRNKKTGAVAHGISGHIPDGWEEVSHVSSVAARPETHKVEDMRMGTGKADEREVLQLHKRVPDVRDRQGDQPRDIA
jgi:hypothetical protein